MLMYFANRFTVNRFLKNRLSLQRLLEFISMFSVSSIASFLLIYIFILHFWLLIVIIFWKSFDLLKNQRLTLANYFTLFNLLGSRYLSRYWEAVFGRNGRYNTLILIAFTFDCFDLFDQLPICKIMVDFFIHLLST